MTDELIEALLKVNPDSTIKDIAGFSIYEIEDSIKFCEKEAQIKRKALLFTIQESKNNRA